MRQVFSSPRLENVERVAELLREQDIEVRITNGRSYRGGRRGNFSYRESANDSQQPAVWVVKSEDQPKARELLRGIGLLDSGRSPTTYLPTSILERDRATDDGGRRRAFRLKMGLLIGIAMALGLGLFAWRNASVTPDAPVVASNTPSIAASTPAQAATPANETNDTAPTAAIATDTYLVDTPSALAAMLIAAELDAHDADAICLAVDGADPSERVMAQLPAGAAARLRPRSACKDDTAALTIEVREYRTDGSGAGTVRVEISDRGGDGDRRVQARTLEVRRDGATWRILRVAM
jgi:hypothetical protein